MRPALSPALAASVLLAALACTACAAYSPAPLPQKPDLKGAEATAAPWTLDDVVARALIDNPDLVAARVQKKVAAVQMRQAGLLAEPTLSGALLPLTAGVGQSLAWNASLTQDLQSLITLSARHAGAKAAAGEVDAQVLWLEWQTASQARLLALQILGGERLLAVQRQGLELFAARDRKLRQALGDGNLALQAAAPDFAAFQAARAQVADSERQQLARRHALNALLGREPDAPLTLADAGPPPALDIPSVDRLAAETVRRRPDLIALRLGYQAQEARVRQAVLTQFPLLSLGVTGGSDNSNVRNAGPQATLTLPVFGAARTGVALERATREQLRAEYRARLDAAYGELRAAVTELAAEQAQLAAAEADLPAAKAAERQADLALSAHALDELAYVDLVSARLAKAQEIATLQQAVVEQQAAIAFLTGAGLPPIDNLPDIAP